jgi:hypothetical protein
MSRRFRHIGPRAKEALNILAIYHNYNWEDEALKPSLEKFGRVRRYDWVEQFNHQEKNWHKVAKTEMNKYLVEQARLWTKDDETDVIFT